jgi:hypothetical protein
MLFQPMTSDWLQFAFANYFEKLLHIDPAAIRLHPRLP